MTSAEQPSWIHLEGSVNVRDLGGLPTSDGRTVRGGVLIRSAHLQDLTEADVALLVRSYGVRKIVDLRTELEREQTGEHLLHREPDVVVEELSLYVPRPKATTLSEVTALGTAADAALASEVLRPGSTDTESSPYSRSVSAYLRYLQARPQALVRALQLIADPTGATLVHCAAGKDRTGVVVAVALAVAGVDPAAVAADYAATAGQLDRIYALLSGHQLYAATISNPSFPVPEAATMLAFFEAVDAEYGSLEDYLDGAGFGPDQRVRLRDRLVS